MNGPPDRNWPEHEVHRFLDELAAGGHDFRRLVERLPVIVYTAELGAHGCWRYVSPQVEEILGYRPEEFVRNPGLWESLLHPEDRDRALAAESEAHLGKRDTAPIAYRMHRRDGEVVWMQDEAVLEADEDGCRSGTGSSTTSASACTPRGSCNAPSPSRRWWPGSASGRCRTATRRS